VPKLLERVRIAVVGLGWVGQEVARAALEDPRVTLVGTSDADPSKAGRDLGEILGEGRLGIVIEPDPRELLLRVRPEVAVVTTTTDLAALQPTLELCLGAGAHVVTTCENLASPDAVDPNVARVLDGLARERNVVVLATGVNPGFAMDRLPVLLSQATRNIRRVRVQRVVDAASRRAQLQAKAGIGLAPKAFAEALTKGRVGHQGLVASLRLVAKGLGVTLDRVTETVRPLIAETPSGSSVLGPVEAGQVRGVYQVARGYRAGGELITLELVIALDEHHAHDTIDVIGEPPLHFEGELPGDQATIAAVLSAIPLVVHMSPGLRTVLDLPAEQPEEPGEPAPRAFVFGGTEAPSRASTQLPRPSAGRGARRARATEVGASAEAVTAAGSAEAAKVTKAAKVARVADSGKAAKVAKAADSAKVAKVAKAAGSAKVAKVAKAAGSAKVAKAAGSAKVAKAGKAAGSAKAAKAADSAKVTKAPKVSRSAEATGSARVTKAADAAKASKAADSAKVTQAAKAADSAKVTKAAKAADSPKASETVKVTKSAKAARSAKTTDSARATKPVKAASSAEPPAPPVGGVELRAPVEPPKPDAPKPPRRGRRRVDP
jgi:4-hydroxy-tetrahydrodipicolinate reductase